MVYPETIKNEIQLLQNEIESSPIFFDVSFVYEYYLKNANIVFNNPFDKELVNVICDALKNNSALSVIRIGDGEINLLTFTYYTSTPNLNYLVAQESIARRCHQFNANKYWLVILQDLMLNAFYQADVIGLLGLWRPRDIKVNDFVMKLSHPKFCRGLSGQFRGVDFMLHQAKKHIFVNKIIATAHLYFSIIKNINAIFANVKNIYLITNNTLSVKQLIKCFPKNNFIHIDIKETSLPVTSKHPSFFNEVYSKLPNNMTGTLTLVGAGIWAQIYCNWVKQKGGVAIDIGSGFDLMVGQLTRKVQRRMDSNIIKQFIIS